MMTEKEWEDMVKTMQAKIASGEITDEPWEDFLHYYVDYDCGISHEFLWNYKGVDYGLYPLEEFGKYEYYIEGEEKTIVFKDIYDAIEKIRLDGMTIQELYEKNLIFFDIG